MTTFAPKEPKNNVDRAMLADFGGFPARSNKREEREKARRFFYLVVDSNQPNVGITSGDLQGFFEAGVNTSSDYVFIFVDIANDDRLRHILSAFQDGEEFYRRVKENTPYFLIMSRIMQEVTDLYEVRGQAIRNYSEDVSLIYEEMGLSSPSTRKAAISFLRRVNRYCSLKPSFFGIGVNINDVITDLIDRLESKLP